MKTPEQLAGLIDHTNLKADASVRDIEKLCAEAAEWRFASVCVNPCNVKNAAELLAESGVKVCTVVGFPLGASSPESKAFEAVLARSRGASEIDAVMNIGWLKSGMRDAVLSDIKGIVLAVSDCTVKVIIEICLLTRAEKILACEIIKEAGAHFAKTSTGFSTGGATADDVKLMREVLGKDFGVKASGGIRDLASALAMLDAGANRLGASASVSICREAESLSKS